MVPEDWLHPERVLLDTPALDLAELIAAAARGFAATTALDAVRVDTALREASRKADFSLGRGVAVPHARLPALERPVVAVLRSSRPIHVGALDMVPADLFFVVLAPPKGVDDHLRMLAHISRLAQSQPLIDGLRRTRDVDEAIALIRAAELQHAVIERPIELDTADELCLALITLQGEEAVDGVVVQLIEDGYGDASVLDAQGMRDAVTHELPLFTGFQDLFGDPDGRRVLLIEVPRSRADDIIRLVRGVCEEVGAQHAAVAVLPLHTRWSWTPPKPKRAAPSGH